MSSDSSTRSLTSTQHAWRRPQLEIVLLGVLIIVTILAYFRWTLTVSRWNDPGAYTFAGWQLAATGKPSYFDANNVAVGPYFTLHGFLVQRDSSDPDFYLSYPVGFPLLLAMVERVIGAQAAWYVVPGLAVVGLLSLFGLGRMLFGRWVGLVAAGLLAFSVDYWTYGTENWSDVPAAALLLAGTCVAVWAARKNSSGGGLLAGALLGYACFIRYVSFLALVPLGLYLWFAMRSPRPYRAIGGVLGGLAILFTAILVYNKVVFGGPLTSGYDPRHGWVPWPALSWSNFVGNSPVERGGILPIIVSLWRNLGIGLIAAIIGLLLMPRVDALLVGGNALIFVLFYSLYLWPSNDARFVVYALAMLCLAAAVAIVRGLSLVLRRRPRWLALAVITLLIVWHLPKLQETQRSLAGRDRQAHNMVDQARSLASAAAPNAVFLSHRYNDLIIMYGQRSALYYALMAPPDPTTQSYQTDQYPAQLVSSVEKLIDQGKPVYLVKEPSSKTLLRGALDPYPILAAHFTLDEVQPEVYEITKGAAPTGN